MATTVKSDLHNVFLVKSSGAVDLANHTAVAAVNTDITVTGMNGETSPLDTGSDVVVQVIAPITLEAGISISAAIILSATQIRLRTTNASAGAVDPASVAAGGWVFAIGRR